VAIDAVTTEQKRETWLGLTAVPALHFPFFRFVMAGYHQLFDRSRDAESILTKPFHSDRKIDMPAQRGLQ
jgi:hypothetical protein